MWLFFVSTLFVSFVNLQDISFSSVNYEYGVFTDPSNEDWDDSVSDCRDWGGELTSIFNEDVRQLANSNFEKLWIGIYWTEEEEYANLNDYEIPVDYQNWKEGNSGSPIYFCATFDTNDGKWTHSSCYYMELSDYICQKSANSLSLYYPFHNGYTYDFSFNHIAGEKFSSPTLTTDYHGNQNQAYRFDGVNDFIQFPYSSSLPYNTTFTISAFVKYGTLGQTGYYKNPIISFSEECGVVMGIREDDDDVKFYFEFSGLWFDSIDDITKEEWTHLAVVNTGPILNFYKNGVWLGWSDDHIGILYSDFDPFGRIGSDAEGSWFFEGVVDDVRIYGQNLTDDQIKEIYDAYTYVPGIVSDDVPPKKEDPSSSTTAAIIVSVVLILVCSGLLFFCLLVCVCGILPFIFIFVSVGLCVTIFGSGGATFVGVVKEAFDGDIFELNENRTTSSPSTSSVSRPNAASNSASSDFRSWNSNTSSTSSAPSINRFSSSLPPLPANPPETKVSAPSTMPNPTPHRKGLEIVFPNGQKHFFLDTDKANFVVNHYQRIVGNFNVSEVTVVDQDDQNQPRDQRVEYKFLSSDDRPLKGLKIAIRRTYFVCGTQ